MNKEGFIAEQIAFETDNPIRGYHFKATNMQVPEGQSLVEISKDGQIVKEFLFPSYKIWNIPAHANDIINSIEASNEDGFYAAGDALLGGNVYQP